MWPLLLTLLSFSVYAQDTDKDLSLYVEMFKLKALKAPSAKNEALRKLGLRLFYDVQLSGKGNISCHFCHQQGNGMGDALPLGLGEGAKGLGLKREQLSGVLLGRHSPSVFNMGLEGVNNLFWDGRVSKNAKGWITPEPGLNGENPIYADIAKTLDSPLAVQALFPIANPAEMLGQESKLSNIEAWRAAEERVFNGRFKATYAQMFKEAYPQETKFNIGHIANAIGEYQRHTFLAVNTPWDLYLRGEKNILPLEAKKGAVVFYSKGMCVNCHQGDHLTVFGFQNIGTPQIGPGTKDGDDLGRFDVTGNPADKYKFRVSPLRNIALTAPYMHDGVYKDLWEVIEHYNHPMHQLMHFQFDYSGNSYREKLTKDERRETQIARAQNMANNLPRMLSLTEEEKASLWCFMVVGLTDVKSQQNLKGVLDENPRCHPVLTR